MLNDRRLSALLSRRQDTLPDVDREITWNSCAHSDHCIDIPENFYAAPNSGERKPVASSIDKG